MNDLDSILSERVRQKFGDQLTQLVDFNSWTPQNRDDQLKKIHEIIDLCSLEALDVIKEMASSTEGSDNPIVLAVLVGLRTHLFELLLSQRNELDLMTEQQINESPIDYEWITIQIRDEALKLQAMQKKLNEQAVAAVTDDSEEV